VIAAVSRSTSRRSGCEVSHGADLSGFVVSDGDDKEFFCAKDNLYGVKSHKLRLGVKDEAVAKKTISVALADEAHSFPKTLDLYRDCPR
jgi:hypothetical protein